MSSDQVHEQEKEKARKKGCGILLTLGLLAFLLVAVPTVGYLFFTMRAAKLVDAELAEIRAAGLPATAEELNAYYEYPPADEDATQLWLAATRPLDGEEYEAARGELPIVGNSDEGEKKEKKGEKKGAGHQIREKKGAGHQIQGLWGGRVITIRCYPFFGHQRGRSVDYSPSCFAAIGTHCVSPYGEPLLST